MPSRKHSPPETNTWDRATQANQASTTPPSNKPAPEHAVMRAPPIFPLPAKNILHEHKYRYPSKPQQLHPQQGTNHSSSTHG